MSAYKQFTTRDVTITPFEVNKGFSFTGSDLYKATGISDALYEITNPSKIEIYSGQNVSTLFNQTSSDLSGIDSREYTPLVYNNIKQLYYSNYLTSPLGDNAVTRSIIPGVSREYDDYDGVRNAPRYENYFQTTLTQSRFFPTNESDYITVLSIPNKYWGENIVPNTFKFTYVFENSASYTIIDDGEGNLILNATASVAPFPEGEYGGGNYGEVVYAHTIGGFTGSLNDIVGQIFYAHGIAVFTTGALAPLGNYLENQFNDIGVTEEAIPSQIDRPPVEPSQIG